MGKATEILRTEPVAIGWFGVPGREGGATHVVADRRPICGTRLHPEAVFQWCSAGLMMPQYIECEKCLAAARVELARRHEEELAKIDRTRRRGG